MSASTRRPLPPAVSSGPPDVRSVGRSLPGPAIGVTAGERSPPTGVEAVVRQVQRTFRRGIPGLAALGLLAALAGCGSGDLSPGVAPFEAGEHAKSADLWREAGGTTPSPDLAYDLGTALWHGGDKARALAWWREARLHAPRDGDVQHDLALARAELDGTPDPVASMAVLEALSPTELAVIAAILLASAVYAAVGWLRGTRSTPPFLAHAAAAAATGLLALQALDEAGQPLAVVVDAPAVIRDLPDADGTVRFTLAPGAEVRVERTRPAWALVIDGKGRRGWTPRSTLEIPSLPREASPPPPPLTAPPPPPLPTVPA
jgi:hypothetical protein